MTRPVVAAQDSVEDQHWDGAPRRRPPKHGATASLLAGHLRHGRKYLYHPPAVTVAQPEHVPHIALASKFRKVADLV